MQTRSRAIGAALMLAACVPAGIARADAAMDAKITALIPELEANIARGMADFHVPGLAIGIVSGDRLVWGKGYGVGVEGGPPVDTDTIFQIGSTTKAFLATTMAIAADRGVLDWNARVVDLYPDFQLQDPWVTREFRVSDLMAQRSGLPPYANDLFTFLGLDETALIRSLRGVPPASSFRSTFTYTNITHLLAGRIVAQALGRPDWYDVVRSEIFEPLGMTRTSLTAEAIETAENTSVGHIYAADGVTAAPFTQLFPYQLDGAGAINSTVNDLVPWLALHLDKGQHDGKQLVSAENLGVTKTPRVAITPAVSYGMGWVLQVTPNGQITWHNGGTTTYGAFIGTLLDRDVGVVILTNETNVGMPDALGIWVLNALLGNPPVDYLAKALASARAGAVPMQPPANPGPPPALADFAGTYVNTMLGKTTVAVDGDHLRLDLDTGATLTLAPWDGDILAVRLVPEGRFAAAAGNLGGDPLGFAQLAMGGSGARGDLLVSLPQNGQTLTFTRQP